MRLNEFNSNVLEPMDHLFKVVFSMILEDIQVSGEIIELYFTKVLYGRVEIVVRIR